MVRVRVSENVSENESERSKGYRRGSGVRMMAGEGNVERQIYTAPAQEV